jgi:hypothetical protein
MKEWEGERLDEGDQQLFLLLPSPSMLAEMPSDLKRNKEPSASRLSRESRDDIKGEDPSIKKQTPLPLPRAQKFKRQVRVA